jgi:hypothetical protein
MRKSGIKIDLKKTDKLFVEHGKTVEKILQFAVREVVIQHKKQGNSIAVWKDGKAILITPDEIEVEKI